MPYIAVYAYPRDEETQRKLAEKLNDAVVEVLGCPPEAVTLSFEGVKQEDWKEQVVRKMVEPHTDKMLILSGKKQY